MDRSDRSMSAGERTDRNAGSEGIEDPAINRSSREAMRGNEREGNQGNDSGRQRNPRQKRQRGSESTGRRAEQGGSVSGQGVPESTPSREATEQTRTSSTDQND